MLCGAKKPSCSAPWGINAAGEAVVCIPGTHSKWARVSGGTVERFATFHDWRTLQRRIARNDMSHAVTGADEARIPKHSNRPSSQLETPALAANLLFRVRSSQLLYGGSSFLGPREKYREP